MSESPQKDPNSPEMFVTKQDAPEQHNEDARKSYAGNDEEAVRKRQEQALMFEKYLEESGLSLSF